MMTRWLPEDEPNMIPGFATHYIGKCTDVQSNLSIEPRGHTGESKLGGTHICRVKPVYKGHSKELKWVITQCVVLNLSVKAIQEKL